MHPKKNTKNTDQNLDLIAKKRTIKAYVMVILGSLVYSFGIVWVMQLTGIISSGVTGSAQLIVGIINKFADVKEFENYLGSIMLVINIPLVIFGWKGVSKRFAILTIISIVVQTITITLLTNLTISPLVYLLDKDNILRGTTGIIDFFTNGFDISKNANTIAIRDEFLQNVEPGIKLLLSIIGGLLTGGGISIALKYGGSTGGVDIISNYFVTKKRMDFTKIPSIIDSTVILLSCLISVEGMLYAIVRLIISIKTIDQIYSSYKTTRLEIVTTKAEEIREELLRKFSHSMTFYDVIGGYSLTTKKVIEVYVSKYEVHDYITIIKKIDPDSFISSSKVKLLRSKFNQRTMV